MRPTIFATLAVFCLACTKTEQTPVADSGMPEAMMPSAISVADVAGTWDMRATGEAGDSLTTFVLVATSDTTPWTMRFPDRDPIPVKILAVNGDSIVTEAGPYQSVLRKGVNVTTHMVNRLQNGKLVGSFEAHYVTAGADSVLRGHVEGTRQP